MLAEAILSGNGHTTPNCNSLGIKRASHYFCQHPHQFRLTRRRRLPVWCSAKRRSTRVDPARVGARFDLQESRADVAPDAGIRTSFLGMTAQEGPDEGTDCQRASILRATGGPAG